MDSDISILLPCNLVPLRNGVYNSLITYNFT